MANLITTDDVLNWTGQVVTDFEITRAQTFLSVQIDRDLDDPNLNNPATTGMGNFISNKDLVKVKYAIAYQCVWMAGTPDYFTRTGEMTEVRQDRLTVRVDNVDAWTLSPLAKKALQRVGFLRSRTLRPVTDFQRGSNMPGLADYDDDALYWRGM